MITTTFPPSILLAEEARLRFVEALRGVRMALRPRVLLADDNDGFAHMLYEALAHRGIAADIAHDDVGVRALLARRSDYALIVIDGASDPSAGDIPVLYVTARRIGEDGWAPRPEAGYRCKTDGADAIADEIAGRIATVR